MRIEVIINGERWTEHGYIKTSRSRAIIEVPMDEYRVNEPGLTVELVKAGFPEGNASKAAIAVACGDWYTSGDLAIRW